MKKLNLFEPRKFVDKVVEAMQLGDSSPKMLLAIRESIESRLSDRIMGTVINSFRDKDLKFFEKLLDERSDIDEMDALLMTADKIPGIEDRLGREITSLYNELIYDAERIDEALVQFNQEKNGKKTR